MGLSTNVTNTDYKMKYMIKLLPSAEIIEKKKSMSVVYQVGQNAQEVVRH